MGTRKRRSGGKKGSSARKAEATSLATPDSVSSSSSSEDEGAPNLVDATATPAISLVTAPPHLYTSIGVRSWFDFFAVIALLCPIMYMWLHVQSPAVRGELAWAVLLSALAFAAVVLLIPTFGSYTRNAGLWGKDLCKKGTPQQDVPVYVWVGLSIQSVV